MRPLGECVMNWRRVLNKNALRLGPQSAILIVAALQMWVVFWNGYSLIGGDTAQYAQSAAEIQKFISTLFGHFAHGAAISWPGGARPKVYATFLMLTDGQNHPIFSIMVQAGITSWLIWLTVRWLSLRHAAALTVLTGFLLAAVSTMPWVVGTLMPDAFTAPLILSIALLAYGIGQYHRSTRLALIVAGGFAFATHPSHTLLALGLLLGLCLLKFLSRHRFGKLTLMPPMAAIGLGWGVLIVSGFILLGVVSPIGARSSPPFFLAAFIGQAREYLAQNCGQATWTLCAYQGYLSDDTNGFLWDTTMPWTYTTEDGKALMKKINAEQAPLLIATFRQNGWQMVRRAAANSLAQLFRAAPTAYGSNVQRALDDMTDAWKADVVQSLQARANVENLVPNLSVETAKVFEVISLLTIAGVLAVPSLRHAAGKVANQQIWLFTAIIVFAIVGNAMICGGLSVALDRYQARVIWLLPFTAILILSCVLQGRGGSSLQGSNDVSVRPGTS